MDHPQKTENQPVVDHTKRKVYLIWSTAFSNGHEEEEEETTSLPTDIVTKATNDKRGDVRVIINSWNIFYKFHGLPYFDDVPLKENGQKLIPLLKKPEGLETLSDETWFNLSNEFATLKQNYRLWLFSVASIWISSLLLVYGSVMPFYWIDTSQGQQHTQYWMGIAFVVIAILAVCYYKAACYYFGQVEKELVNICRTFANTLQDQGYCLSIVSEGTPRGPAVFYVARFRPIAAPDNIESKGHEEEEEEDPTASLPLQERDVLSAGVEFFLTVTTLAIVSTLLSNVLFPN